VEEHNQRIVKINKETNRSRKTRIGAKWKVGQRKPETERGWENGGMQMQRDFIGLAIERGQGNQKYNIVLKCYIL
jgi:hypothetical protein